MPRRQSFADRAWNAFFDLIAWTFLLAIISGVVFFTITASPFLRETVVPDRFRATVDSLAWEAPFISEWGAGARSPAGGTLPVPQPVQGPTSGAGTGTEGAWEVRRAADVSPPAGLVNGEDFSVQTTDDGNIVHWSCEAPIPVRAFEAPPGSAPDLAWAVESVARASGLPLVYSGEGTSSERGAPGSISVTYGDDPAFAGNEKTAGVGGTRHYADGRVTRGQVVLRPGKLTFTGADPASRAVVLHELAHAVGMTHAAEGRPEVMAPAVARTPQTEFGPGDRVALSLIGCR